MYPKNICFIQKLFNASKKYLMYPKNIWWFQKIFQSINSNTCNAKIQRDMTGILLASESSTTCAVVVVTRSRRRGEELARVTIMAMAGGWLTQDQEQEWLLDMQSRSCDHTTLDTRLISCGHHLSPVWAVTVLPCYTRVSADTEQVWRRRRGRICCWEISNIYYLLSRSIIQNVFAIL